MKIVSVHLVYKPYMIAFTKKYGRGLYATANIPKNRTIILNDLATGSYGGDLSNRYSFEVDKKTVGIALGDVSLANHSEKPNATWEIDAEAKTIWLVATKLIKAGQQIFINYGYTPKEGKKWNQKKRKK
jgi:SET domain-containing protein